MSIKEHVIYNLMATGILGIGFLTILLIFEKIISATPFN